MIEIRYTAIRHCLHPPLHRPDTWTTIRHRSVCDTHIREPIPGNIKTLPRRHYNDIHDISATDAGFDCWDHATL